MVCLTSAPRVTPFRAPAKGTGKFIHSSCAAPRCLRQGTPGRLQVPGAMESPAQASGTPEEAAKDVLSIGPQTILAFGALLSERSARLTFPDLQNFRLGRVKGLRRVFAHPHLFLISQGVVDPNTTMRIASLSAEPVEMQEAGFVVGAFDVEMTDSLHYEFFKREPEYDFQRVTFTEVSTGDSAEKEGIICVAAEDSRLRSDVSVPKSVTQVWGWPSDSGMLPADVYLRHCVLSAEKAGPEALASFLDETLLCDRTTSLRKYMVANPNIMDVRPPVGLEARFSG